MGSRLHGNDEFTAQSKRIGITTIRSRAMKKATYEALPDGTFYGEIPGFRGVLANAPLLDECRRELRKYWKAG